MAYLQRMRPPLVRFGVAIDAPLLGELDKLVAERGCTRSEMFRDLARAEVVRAKVRSGVDAVAALTIVYDHHVRDLSERLTELQHQLGDGVRSAMHVHLSHDYCLEVIVIRGKSDRLQAVADKILAMRGVKHGGIEIVSDGDLGASPPVSRSGSGAANRAHSHSHPHPHSAPRFPLPASVVGAPLTRSRKADQTSPRRKLPKNSSSQRKRS